MQTTLAQAAHAPVAGSWFISKEGAAVATVDLHEEAGRVVVAARIEGSTSSRSPFRFSSFEAADAFVRDLIASFAYLGCDVAAKS
jgi:hypothetical protein